MDFQKKLDCVLTVEDRWESLDTIFVTHSLFKGTVVDFTDFNSEIKRWNLCQD